MHNFQAVVIWHVGDGRETTMQFVVALYVGDM